MNYLKSTKLFTDYVSLNENLITRIISFLLKMYPECSSNYMTNMNLEEMILFQAKIIRLEGGKVIHTKCYKNIYPREWIYHFDDKCGGHEFLRRYWMIVNHMRDKYFAKIDGFDFDALYKACIELMDICQCTANKYNDTVATKKYEIFSNELNQEEKEALLDVVHKKIKEINTIYNDGANFLKYLYGIQSKEEFLKYCDHKIDFYRIQTRESNRTYSFFDPKKAMRKMDYLPLVLTYLVMVDYNMIENQLLYPKKVDDQSLKYIKDLYDDLNKKIK